MTRIGAWTAGFLALAWASGALAAAGEKTQALRQCALAALTTDDKATLLQFAFADLSLNPEVKPLWTASPQQLEDLQRRTVAVIERVATQACRDQAVAALKADGDPAIEETLASLIDVAMQKLDSWAPAEQATSGLGKFFDRRKWRQLMIDGGLLETTPNI